MSNTTISAQRSQLITSENHGGYVTIVAVMMMVCMILFYIIRIVVRYAFNNIFAYDDIIVTVGTIMGIAHSITIMFTVKAGLGKHISKISADNLQHLEVMQYAADLLFIMTITIAKISSAELVARLTRQKKHMRACRLVSFLIIVWGIASVFTIAIGCHPSHPWSTVDRCSNLAASWIGIGTIDVVLELALISLPIYLVMPLQMNLRDKSIVLLAFSCRIPIMPLAVLRLVSLSGLHRSSDYPWDVILATVYAQIEMHYSLIAASIPCLRPFLKAWNTGYMATQVGQVDRTGLEQDRSSMYVLHSKNSTKATSSYANSRLSRGSFPNSSMDAKSLPQRLTRSLVATIAPTPDKSIERAISPSPLPSPTFSRPNQMSPKSGPLLPSPTFSKHTRPSSRKWKCPDELPVQDPCSAPAIPFIQHPRQWRKSNGYKRSVPEAISSTQEAERRSRSTSNSPDRLVIHMTIDYTVTHDPIALVSLLPIVTRYGYGYE
ncbi:hypothetical protein EJ08DRAFT_691592 [Tothia fuscella]|uniref:Rhodopsin domain-containing protein n=1 Tax=Tothia fuscella TaxID=1048955 RepID=A0A9P4P4F5_9PEZI|nr:hypothetical protein EJ08DRAFT_691592 [Tothia fuscella]